MKKLLLIAFIGLVGCSKEDICLEFTKRGSDTIYVCNDETNNISVVAYTLTNDGYLCKKVYD